jgi:hypothetical protein
MEKTISAKISEEAMNVIHAMQGKFALKGQQKNKHETLDFILLDYKKKLADKFKI